MARNELSSVLSRYSDSEDNTEFKTLLDSAVSDHAINDAEVLHNVAGIPGRWVILEMAELLCL